MRTCLGWLAAAVLLAAPARLAAEPVLAESFTYRPGLSLAASGRGAPGFALTTDEEPAEDGSGLAPGRTLYAVVAPQGLTRVGHRARGQSALVGTVTDGHSAKASVTLQRPLPKPLEEPRRLYMSLLICVQKEADLTHPGARVGAALKAAWHEETKTTGNDLALGMMNHEEEGLLYAALGPSRAFLGKAVAGRTYQLALRFTDEPGDWNAKVEAVLDPEGRAEPAEWQEVTAGKGQGMLKVTALALFAERAGWKRMWTRAVGLVDEIHIGTAWEDVCTDRSPAPATPATPPVSSGPTEAPAAGGPTEARETNPEQGEATP